MKIGVNLLLYATAVTKEHTGLLEAIKAAGADGVEIPTMEGEVGAYAELGRVLDGLGLARTSSMAFTSADANPVSDDPRQRQGAIDHLNWLIDCAHAMGSTVICGPMFQTIGQFTGNGATEAELARAAAALLHVADRAAAAGITLALEPLNRFECYLISTLKEGAAFTRRINHPAVGVLFDTFHANIEEKDMARAIREQGRGVIRHVHCSANDRGIPGEDHIPWDGVFDALKSIGYDGWLVIEAFGRSLPGLAAATKIWRDLFPDPLDVARKGVPFVRGAWEGR
ncbi:MAG: TIM barrel protein [Kiritimatiellaeota bacterium]|nr:TIM barrel protein [Kiritimatiellota bacterium]